MESGLDHNYNKILDILKGAIKDNDNQVKARKHLRVERWLRVYIQLIEDFDDERLKFFSDIFSDNSCWDGVKLKNKAVGERLIEEKNQSGKENPLNLSDRYYLACKYCLEDKIPGLFEQVFMKFKNSAFEEGSSDHELRNELLDHHRESSSIKAFWSFLVDGQFNNLKDYEAINGFKEAIEKNWSEGIEFFYGKLQNDKDISNKGGLLVDAALSTLSVTRRRCYEDENIIEFCLLNMNDHQKKELSQKEPKGFVCRALLKKLANGCCFDSFKDLFNYLESNDLQFEEYGCFLSSLSGEVLKNPDLAEQAREAIMYIWEHKSFEECRKSVFEDYSIIYALADLVVNLRKEDGSNDKKEGEILKILKYIGSTQIQKVKDSLIKKMRVFHGIGKEQFTKDKQLIERLFSELGKSSERAKERSITQDRELAAGAGDASFVPQSELSSTNVCNIEHLSLNK